MKTKREDLIQAVHVIVSALFPFDADERNRILESAKALLPPAPSRRGGKTRHEPHDEHPKVL